MVFTAFQARRLHPEEVNPMAGAVSKALQGYGQGMNAAYLPKKIEADIFAKQIGPLATLATTPAFLQNPQFQAALGQIIAKHLGYGQGGSGGGEGGAGMPTYASQTKKDVQDAEAIANDLSKSGNSFHESPGFKFALQQALQGAGHAAAAGGMAGSPQHEQQNMGLATDLANQDYYNYMQGATGLYGQGLSGMQGLSQQGQQAGQSLADQIAQSLGQKAQYDYEGQAEEVFSEHKDENPMQRLERIKRTVPSLFQQDEAMADEAAGETNPQGDQNTAMDVEDENNLTRS